MACNVAVRLGGRWSPQLTFLRWLIAFDAAILISNEPIDGAKRQDCRREREKLQGIGRSEIKDNQFADDGEKRDQYHGAHLHYTFLPSATTRSERLNSSAMMTLKIAPNMAWNTE